MLELVGMVVAEELPMMEANVVIPRGSSVLVWSNMLKIRRWSGTVNTLFCCLRLKSSIFRSRFFESTGYSFPDSFDANVRPKPLPKPEVEKSLGTRFQCSSFFSPSIAHFSFLFCFAMFILSCNLFPAQPAKYSLRSLDWRQFLVNIFLWFWTCGIPDQYPTTLVFSLRIRIMMGCT